MKKIISFSLYGNNKIYLIGALENAKLQPKIYPDWKCRFYVDETVPKKYIDKLRETSEVIIKPKEKGHLLMFARFEPLKDISIDRFIVRDADSRINEKEAIAVKEWEESNKRFHIMRDNIVHNAYICGGMWGATKEFIKEEAPLYDDEVYEYLNSISPQRIFHNKGMYFNADQPWLWKYIWPKIVNSHIAHIKDLDNLRFTGNERLFLKENIDGMFVGEPIEV